MDNYIMQVTQQPIVTTGMLIRRPVEEVFRAFTDPAITTKFWFTKSSGKLEAGKRIQWEWEMYGVGTEVHVLEVEDNRRILMEWSPPDVTVVEWTFEAHEGYGEQGEQATYVQVTNSGFHGTGDDMVREALDSTGGFTMVLCAAKALLEHQIVLTVVADKAPPAG